MRMFITCLRLALVLGVLCCVLYPALVWGVARLAFPARAQGSLILHGGKTIGSALVGQKFVSPGYFHGRYSAVDYDAAASGASNLGPTNPALLARFGDAVTSAALLGDAVTTSTIAFDRISGSGSGLDPDITPANALQQAARVARTRAMSQPAVRDLLRRHTHGPLLGVLGPARVNVLELNLALDEAAPAHPPDPTRARSEAVQGRLGE